MSKLLVLLLIFSAPILLNAQCDGDNPNCTAWSTANTVTISLGDPECNASVSYVTRICNGVREFYVTGFNVNWGCVGFDSPLSYFHRNRNALHEYFVLGLISQYAGTIGYTVPPCSTGANQIVQTYVASCGIWLACEYTLPDEVQYACDRGWTGPPPHTTVSPKKVKSWKWFSCGTQCCKRTWNVCEASSGDGSGSTYTKATLVGKTAIGECSGQATFNPKPCETDCQ